MITDGDCWYLKLINYEYFVVYICNPMENGKSSLGLDARTLPQRASLISNEQIGIWRKHLVK